MGLGAQGRSGRNGQRHHQSTIEYCAGLQSASLHRLPFMVSVPVLSQPGAANTRTISQPWKAGVPSALPSRAATTEPAVKSTPGRVTCAHSRWIRLPRVHGRFWMESESSQRKDLGQKHRARFRLYVKEPVPVCSRSGMRSKLYYVVNGKQRGGVMPFPKTRARLPNSALGRVSPPPLRRGVRMVC